MDNLKLFIESGILELYASGNCTAEENGIVERMAANFVEVRLELDSINEAIELYALSHMVKPGPVTKLFLMASIDYTERLKSGEQPCIAPVLSEDSTLSDFSEWLNRPDLVLPDNFTDLHAKIISYTPTAVTAIIWIRDTAPQEVHDDEYEKFLVVEGSCDITVGDNVHSLLPGDFFAIPLYKNHQVLVTSSIPCKVILQRMAA